ncbi:TetR family transcriptional regulator [Microbacter sp. GSS18]|nr:TetR family transcriptional regulator [Microbacter sp. GSS18]
MDAVTTEHAEPEPVGLRERRRLETQREVSDAALALFERKGVGATTVDDIAHAAGISPRTFFRYFPAKEHAVFLDDPEGDLLVRAALAALRGGATPAAAVEEGWRAIFAAFEADPEGRRRARRVRHVIFTEPAILAVALRRDADQASELAEALSAEAQTDPVRMRVLVEVFGAAARQAFNEWARRQDAGEPAPVDDIWLDLRRGLVDFAQHIENPALPAS